MAGANQVVKFKLNGPQTRAYRALQANHTVTIPWGRGVGKSHFARNWFWSLVAKLDGVERKGALKPMRGVRGIVLMPTLKQFKDIHGDLMIDELANEFAFLGGKVDRTRMSVTFPGGSWLKPFPAAEHSSKTARGLRGDVLIADEFDDIDRSVYESVVTPWFSEPWSLRMKLLGGTPRRGRFGLLYQMHQLGLDPEVERYHSFHATYRDAPKMVSPEAVEDARLNTLPATFAREWECDFDAGEGLVYPFDESYHVRTPPPLDSFREFLVGVDHGWTDPGVFLLCGILGHGNDAVMWILDEIYETGQPIHVWNERARGLVAQGIRTFWCDRSRPDLIRGYVHSGADANGADNDIQAGIARVADLMFKRPTESGEFYSRLFVSPKCRNTISEFGTYRRKRDPRDPEAFQETPEDKNNHAMDALRYAAIMRFGRCEHGKTVVTGR